MQTAMEAAFRRYAILWNRLLCLKAFASGRNQLRTKQTFHFISVSKLHVGSLPVLQWIVSLLKDK